VLSEAVADGHLVLGQRHASQWALLLGGAATVGSAVVWVIAPDLVRIMFERGAFTAEASAEVTTVLRFGLLQLPFYFAGIALVQWISASGRYGALFAIAFVALVVKIVMNLLLIHPFGLAGLMAATATMYAVSFLGQLAFVMRKND
jgi:putative peptidoglycan lipid II flippase